MNRILILLASLFLVGNVYSSGWKLSNGIGWE